MRKDALKNVENMVYERYILELQGIWIGIWNPFCFIGYRNTLNHPKTNLNKGRKPLFYSLLYFQTDSIRSATMTSD